MIHGIYSFRKLRTTCLINAAGVDPNIIKSMRLRDQAGLINFFICCLFVCNTKLHLLERNFIFSPRMQKLRVEGDPAAFKFFKFTLCVDFFSLK